MKTEAEIRERISILEHNITTIGLDSPGIVKLMKGKLAALKWVLGEWAE